jgi:hypothetical protein
MNVLIVALDAVAPEGMSGAEVLVVAPALNSRVRHWLSDEDDARRRAEEVAEAFVHLLGRDGVHAEGRVGDSDPVLAIADALPTFAAEEIVIAGGSEHSAEIVARVRRRFALPTRAAESLPRAA